MAQGQTLAECRLRTQVREQLIEIDRQEEENCRLKKSYNDLQAVLNEIVFQVLSFQYIEIN